ncbi:von Willebrand factor C domain-containing protein 2-like isoform X2 [Hemitrygon akajei]|uniref:von Willebrand factor C domain-containing protein 2-like isoform X2 n=1 Tax=Hemitrygon akajei TaxID=2704970 RepID=UPI003BF97103
MLSLQSPRWLPGERTSAAVYSWPAPAVPDGLRARGAASSARALLTEASSLLRVAASLRARVYKGPAALSVTRRQPAHCRAMADWERAAWLVLLCLALLHLRPGAARVNDILPQGQLDYTLPDYRGKGCIDDKGFVFDVGERFYPTARSCPCVCTAVGPVCQKPHCPRLPARCVQVSYRSCCPHCLQVRNSCQYGGQTYKLYQEFWPSACEKCRCEADRQVYCLTAECPPVYCVNPSYEPNRCCPVCKQGLVALVFGLVFVWWIWSSFPGNALRR